MYRPDLQSIALLVPARDNSDCSFGLGLRKVGKGEAVGGRGWYRSKEQSFGELL